MVDRDPVGGMATHLVICTEYLVIYLCYLRSLFLAVCIFFTLRGILLLESDICVLLNLLSRRITRGYTLALESLSTFLSLIISELQLLEVAFFRSYRFFFVRSFSQL